MKIMLQNMGLMHFSVSMISFICHLDSALDNRNNDEESSKENDRDNSSYTSSPRRRNRQSMYYDPNNDNFDHESDEDFIMDASPERTGTRRTIRRQGYNTGDATMGNEERKERSNQRNRFIQRANAQREERERRRRARNRRREIDDSNDDPDDYVVDDVVEEESEDSEDSLLQETSIKKKAVIRNHNFYSSRMEEDKDESDDEEIIPQKVVPPKKNQFTGIFSDRKVIVEEEKENYGSFKSFGHFLSRNNNETYTDEKTRTRDGYAIDVEEALNLRKEDKSQLDCALCKKKRGDYSLIGPFKYYIQDKVIDEMVYWFHRECLERNDIVNQISKHEFEHIQECINEWIFNEGHSCTRCENKGASIS